MAVRLAKFFGTTEQFWLNLQGAYDVGRAKRRLARTLREIKPKPRNAVASLHAGSPFLAPRRCCSTFRTKPFFILTALSAGA